MDRETGGRSTSAMTDSGVAPAGLVAISSSRASAAIAAIRPVSAIFIVIPPCRNVLFRDIMSAFANGLARAVPDAIEVSATRFRRQMTGFPKRL
jgi:hypothetical protein